MGVVYLHLSIERHPSVKAQQTYRVQHMVFCPITVGLYGNAHAVLPGIERMWLYLLRLVRGVAVQVTLHTIKRQIPLGTLEVRMLRIPKGTMPGCNGRQPGGTC